MQYVVLQIDSDDTHLIESLKNRWLLTEEDVTELSEAKLVGLFRGPTKFCDNSDGHRGKKTDSGYTRGMKYGWWVCGKCKKPTTKWASNLNAVLGAAKNLL